jgi:hypothetical protein
VVLVETGSHFSGYDRTQQVAWLAEGLLRHWTFPQDRIEYYRLLEQAESGRFDVVLTSADPIDPTDLAFVASERMEQGSSVLFWELAAVGSGLAQQAPFAFERVTCPAVSVGDRWEDLSSLMRQPDSLF